MSTRRWIFSERRAAAVSAWLQWTKEQRGPTPTPDFAAGYAFGVADRERALAEEGIEVL